MTSDECDVLYQLENDVLAVYKSKIQTMRNKLKCPTPGYVPQVIAYGGVNAVDASVQPAQDDAVPVMADVLSADANGSTNSILLYAFFALLLIA